ncbi:unnamed protein product [marine sediment metagenome]|uniref:Uncharacterized protein n=1 Tax=marine sediment metagenome TaxID=412755 RepID=X1GPE6_9ZZZZ
MSDVWAMCKNCFIAMFIESTEEVARAAVKQYVERQKRRGG